MVKDEDIKVHDLLRIKADHTVVREFVVHDGIKYAKTARGILVPLTAIWKGKDGLVVE